MFLVLGDCYKQLLVNIQENYTNLRRLKKKVMHFSLANFTFASMQNKGK